MSIPSACRCPAFAKKLVHHPFVLSWYSPIILSLSKEGLVARHQCFFDMLSPTEDTGSGRTGWGNLIPMSLLRAWRRPAFAEKRLPHPVRPEPVFPIALSLSKEGLAAGSKGFDKLSPNGAVRILF